MGDPLFTIPAGRRFFLEDRKYDERSADSPREQGTSLGLLCNINYIAENQGVNGRDTSPCNDRFSRMTQRLRRRGGGNSISMLPEKCRSAISQKKPDARKPLFSDNSCYIRLASSQNWMFLRRSRVHVDVSRIRHRPRFYYRIFETAITMPSCARGENNRDVSP